MRAPLFKKKAFSIVLVLLLAGGTLLQSGCTKNESRTETACLPPNIIQSPLLSRYFDNYELGSYWIYSTADSLQSDSLYVTRRRHTTFIDRDCNVEDSTVITAHSNVLNLQSGESVFRIGEGGRITTGMVQTLALSTATGQRILALEALYQEGKFSYYCKGCGLPPADAQPVQKLNYRHPALLGRQTLDTVWQQFGTVIAPGLGIVQFVKPGTTDTFYLQRTNF